MKTGDINKIIKPLYAHLFLLVIYYFTIVKVNSEFWSNIMLYSILIGIPVITLVLINIRLIILQKKPKILIVFLLSALPGLVTGIWFGYNIRAAHFFPSTIIGLIKALAYVGLLGAVIFGTLGVLINLIYLGFKKLLKKA